ncbi:receptor-like protein 46 [Quercus suber]|uniref:receptor-like protein 46 n=1 Tax=Quercus suber TaxID=58331 RepID=UPI000CE26270|nr:receptor-like protein 12 [Quercus suber]POE61440.1 receptor-like protein 12 [Quercus suber]
MAKLSLPLLLLVLLIVFTTSFSCPQHQKEALLHFKVSLINATSSFPSAKEDVLLLFESWNSSPDCCDWYRVYCDYQFGSRNVIALNLGDNVSLEPAVLASTILTPLFHIRSLEKLDLSLCGIQGELPGDGIANLTKLINLDLSCNDFSGSIPSQIFNLRYLQNLDVSYNSFSGNIPNEIGNKTELQGLSLQHNNFFGKIPSSILNLKRLETLDLSSNSLSMEIPIDIGNLSNMIILIFRNNVLTGTILSSIWKLPKLEVLDLENNLFIGEIPFWLFNITRLVSLFLGGNNLIWNTKAKIVQSLR